MTGVLIGWLFAIFTWFDPTIAKGWLIIDGLWFGTLVGVVMGLFMYWARKSPRHFGSAPSRVGVTPPSTAKSTPRRPRGPAG